LEDRPVNVLALLTEDQDRFLRVYVLPPKIVQDHWKQFARSGDQIEITVRKNTKGSALVLPGKDVPIQQYEGNYSALE
jgi:hypothetical protein